MLNYNKYLTSVLVKPAGPDCNMKCSYCFYLEKEELYPGIKARRMRVEVLEEMTKQVLDQNTQEISFTWQGGEPTLMGLEFYRKAVDLQIRYGAGKTVGNGLQTNGILLDESWAELFAKYKFLIGLSLDGPEHIHDHYRSMSSGEPSFKKVYPKSGLLIDAGVEVNALSVINDYSVNFPEEIYSFFRDSGLRFMQFIPCVEAHSGNPAITSKFSVNPGKYGEFLCRTFDLWVNDFRNGEPMTSVRYFDSVFYNYAYMIPPECTLLHECGTYTVIEHNGDVYSCDFFVEPDWKLGNIMNCDVVAMLNSEKQSDFGGAKSFLPDECRSCDWLKYCWGGCPKDRQYHPDINGLNYFCTAFRMFFEHSDPVFKKLAEDWKMKNYVNRGYGTGQRSFEVERTQIKAGRNDLCYCGSGKKYKNCCDK